MALANGICEVKYCRHKATREGTTAIGLSALAYVKPCLANGGGG
jgi:hypothetical protein